MESQRNKVSITFDKNIELVGYLIHLADPDANNPNHPITIELNNYLEDKQHPAIADIFAIAGNLDYTTIIRLFYSLPDFPLAESYVVPDSLLISFGFESASEQEDIRKLIARVHQFTTESGFQQLWLNLNPFRDSTKVLVDKNKPSEALLSEMEEFYQKDFSEYQIVPSLTLWSGPGWGFETEGNTATFILGPLAKNYDYTDTDYLQAFSVHEFGHSFVNSTVLEHAQKVIAETSHLYEPLRENMTRQGYNNWSSSLIEHFVRSGEVIIAELMDKPDLKEKMWSEYVVDREFFYLPFIVDKLKYYRYQKEFSYEKAVMLTLQDFQKEYTE